MRQSICHPNCHRTAQHANDQILYLLWLRCLKAFSLHSSIDLLLNCPAAPTRAALEPDSQDSRKEQDQCRPYAVPDRSDFLRTHHFA